ncbi:hypothetical protein nvc1_063 [Namao virus]|nr:hypothetical protein nvc1_063 [Namao virus]
MNSCSAVRYFLSAASAAPELETMVDPTNSFFLPKKYVAKGLIVAHHTIECFNKVNPYLMQCNISGRGLLLSGTHLGWSSTGPLESFVKSITLIDTKLGLSETITIPFLKHFYLEPAYKRFLDAKLIPLPFWFYRYRQNKIYNTIYLYSPTKINIELQSIDQPITFFVINDYAIVSKNPAKQPVSSVIQKLDLVQCLSVCLDHPEDRVRWVCKNVTSVFKISCTFYPEWDLDETVVFMINGKSIPCHYFETKSCYRTYFINTTYSFAIDIELVILWECAHAAKGSRLRDIFIYYQKTYLDSLQQNNEYS